MAAFQRKLVHKQFNSPIGLYSDNNVKATLNRELKVLSNGTMGIDFDDISKPTNLANSAVLRMLEEEENQKRQARQPGGLKRVAWPPEPEYQSPSAVVPQPQESLAQANTYHQPSQNQSPNQYNNARQQSHDLSAIEDRNDPYRQGPPVHPQYNQSYPSQQSQPTYQHQYPNEQLQSTEVDNHPQPIYQRQHSQSLGRQSRSRITPGRMFANPDPCFMKINKPAHLQPVQRTISPSAGGPIAGRANGGTSPQYQVPSSPNYQQQSQPSPNHYQQQSQPSPIYQQQSQPSPNYQQQSQPSPNHYQQSQSPRQFEPSPQYQSPDPNRSLVGWSPVRKPVQVSSGYTLNNQRPSAEPSSAQSYAANQNQYQPPSSHQPSASSGQYQPYEASQQQYQPQQQQHQQQSTPSNEHYQAQQPFYRQPSPGVITLRKEAPYNQEPAPVFTSSPSAASFGGGTNMRGDQKWPPQEYKLQSEVDNEARRRLAQGPVLRPRRVQKDKHIKEFFDQHAIHNYYRHYNVPPGTQSKLNYF